MSMRLQLREMTDILRTDNFERTIPYLYLDSVGLLTVGVGHNLKVHPVPNVLSMSFVVKRLERHATSDGDAGIPITESPAVGRAATPKEIQNDIDFLKRHPGLKHYAPQHLAKYTTVELTQRQINRLFDQDREEAIHACGKEFGVGTFESFPLPCQAALMDIAFNCGSFWSFRGHFVPAIKGTGQYAGKSWKERWTAAAQYSRRGAVGAIRNAIVRDWLLEGARLSEKAGAKAIA